MKSNIPNGNIKLTQSGLERSKQLFERYFDSSFSKLGSYLKEAYPGEREAPSVSTVRRYFQKFDAEIGVSYQTFKKIRNILWKQDSPAPSWSEIAEEVDKSSAAGEPIAPLAISPEVAQLPSSIADKLEDFVGRTHVLDAIDEFIEGDDTDRGFFTLLGDPGEGKSAIAAKYIQENPGCVFHFNIKQTGQNTAAEFLEKVCWQIIKGYSLPYTELPQQAVDSGSFLQRLLEEVSKQLSASQKLRIVVDGLDEVNLYEQKGGNVLYLPRSLPKNVYFLLTSRRAGEVKSRLLLDRPTLTYDLLDYKQDAEKDIEEYIRKVLSPAHRLFGGLDAWIRNQPDLKDQEKFVATMIKKSDRNFMYVTLVLQELANPKGIYRNIQLQGLPEGLIAYYDDHWERMGMNRSDRPKIKLDIVHLYSKVRREVPIIRMLQYARRSEQSVTIQEIRDVVDGWEQFLHRLEIEGMRCYRIYHTSYNDFLKTKLERDESEYDGMITEVWDDWFERVTGEDDDDEMEED